MHLKDHFFETKSLLEEIPSEEVARWLLNEGFFPERYVLPPSFKIKEFNLGSHPYKADLKSLPRRKPETISHPKTSLTSRQFGIIHPENYHDIVFHLNDNWKNIIEHLFPVDQRIYSYSFPIPLTKNNRGRPGKIRTGRMIYEWLSMAEKDLILDAGKYQVIARTDITNFYNSIYTHTIPWALHGREEALKDKDIELYGNKLDRLLQYANDARTNGIMVGPALTDLIAEILLSAVDREVSKKLEKVDFVGARFKDDYRILCQREKDAQKVLKTISDVLEFYNLVLNERKTTVLHLPDGLYRDHDREYFPHRLRNEKYIDFKTFEHTLLIALDIHRRFPGTSILEKFISELFDKNKNIKIRFSSKNSKEEKEVKKMIELLFFAKRESQKLTCHVLSVCEKLYELKKFKYPNLKPYLADRIKYEIETSSEEGDTFEILWYIFFSRFVGLGITGFDGLISNEQIKNNEFYKSMLMSKQEIFKDSDIDMFIKPKDCKYKSLAEHISVF